MYKGERARTKDNTMLSRFELSGISSAPRGVPQIEISFDIEPNGILNFSAADMTTGRSKRNTVTNGEGRLSREKIEYILNEFERHKTEDEAAAARSIITKIALKSCLYNLCNFINDEKLKLETAVNETIALSMLRQRAQRWSSRRS
jgi:L1 cell adhesion molecule like protein